MDLSDSDSESDFEMKADLTDLESDSEEEYKASRRRVARKTHSGSRVLSGGRKSVQNPGTRRSGSNPLQAAVPDSIPEDSTPGRSAGGLCCSCSSWSGCKTKKCACKAAGGFCGAQCGCNVGRCANRWEIATSETTPSFSTNELIAPAQTAMAAAMAGLRVDSSPLGTPPISGSILSTEGVKSDELDSDRALVKKGVTLLDSAYKQSLRGSVSPEDNAHTTGDERRRDSEVGSKRPRRPLSDIGNNKVRHPSPTSMFTFCLLRSNSTDQYQICFVTVDI